MTEALNFGAVTLDTAALTSPLFFEANLYRCVAHAHCDQ